ncbi:MAG: hypothetical protein GF307_12230 [candidate division Zixibacteria bacterium]|nr:hypothetical protein [candidate division Zixibacteria bacterium]
MKNLFLLVAIFYIAILLGGCNSMNSEIDVKAEKAAINKVIHNSIGWAANKDKELSYSCFADDPELFWFSPEDEGTIYGFKSLVELTEGVFMRNEFKAIGYEIRELKINLSGSGDVAWYHARLDDFNEWNGQPANWEDVRWTGVLEKRDGRWVIVQMHFSEPTGRQ